MSVRHPHSLWSLEREQLLAVLWTQGLSAGQISKRLGVTRSAVIGKVHRLGLPKRSEASHGNARSMENKAKNGALRGRAMPSAPRLIRAAAPTREPPERSDTAVRFLERAPNQCAMFCAGEEGADGYVCGAPVVIGAWCIDCARLAYQPEEKRRAG